MSSDNFVHLHVHTEYSVLDSSIRVSDLMKKCKQLGMSAVAMTDHANLYGVIEFYQDAKKYGIKPIIGCELNLAPTTPKLNRAVANRLNYTHITLWAENNTGYANLVKLVTRAHLEGVYLGKPRVDLDDLAEFSEGIIASSGCKHGPVAEFLNNYDTEGARKCLQQLAGIFAKGNFYVELQNHDNQQASLNEQLVQLAGECNLPLVATNGVHFLEANDYETHDILVCIGQNATLHQNGRKRYSSQVYFKDQQQMGELFKQYPEALQNSALIAERCNVSMTLDPTSSEKYPQFGTPDGSSREDYFRLRCFQGLAERYGKQRAQQDRELIERLEYEIKTINDLGFASYFLITADFIGWARDQGIPVGPGRGSAAGSLVAYTMGITDICPLRFGLLFERFLNPERVSPPDVDIDFCQSRRQEVINYVRNKYGERAVSNIITYGTMAAKSALRDVGRVMGYGFSDMDRIAKLIETKPGVTLQKEWQENEDLRNLIESNDDYRELWNYALKLEGLVRNVGVHAAGVVIGDRNLDEYVPLTRDNEGGVVSQMDMGAITEVGLLKMDFLGLKNLTVIQDAVNYITQLQEHRDFDIRHISLDDKPTFSILNRGETLGVFQLESGGMVETCKKYGIDKIEDIIDLLALYRPGAMQFIDEMIEVKKGLRQLTYEHPLLEQVCGNTYGVMIYQEQVQNAAKLLAGYTLGGADLLRRAMGKKKPEEMAKQKVTFLEGAKQHNNIDAELASRIFDKIERFAGYGFNKSHSACYGHISYWTAYLKANFPVQFLAALLSNEVNNTDKIGVFIAECSRLGIEMLPPNINKSGVKFAPEMLPCGKLAIRYGLLAIKNVGEQAVLDIVKNRQEQGAYSDFSDFCKRLDGRTVNRRILEALIKCGAFDWTRVYRSELIENLEGQINAAASVHRDRLAGQDSMFDMLDFAEDTTSSAQNLTTLPEFNLEQRLEDEKSLCGYYISAHPLDQYRGLIDGKNYQRLGLVEEMDIDFNSRKRYSFAGLIRSLQIKTTKAGKKFAVIVLEDFTAAREVLLWSETMQQAQEAGVLETGKIITLKLGVQIDSRGESLRLTGYDLVELEGRKKRSSNAQTPLEITVSSVRHDGVDLARIQEILSQHSGRTPVLLHVVNSIGGRVSLELGERYRVQRSQQLMDKLGPLLLS